jgi:hypothetical protein
VLIFSFSWPAPNICYSGTAIRSCKVRRRWPTRAYETDLDRPIQQNGGAQSFSLFSAGIWEKTNTRELFG